MSDLELRNIYENMFKENEPHRTINLAGSYCVYLFVRLGIGIR